MANDPLDPETLPAQASPPFELAPERMADRLPQRVQGLRFAGTLEHDFRAYAYESAGPARTTALRGLMAVLLLLTATDVFQATRTYLPLVTPGILAARLAAIALLALTLARVTRNADWRQGHRWLRNSLLGLGAMAVVTSSLYASAAVQLPVRLLADGNLLVMMAMLFPVGYVYTACLKITGLYCAAAWLIVPVFMPPALLDDFLRILPLQLTGLVAATLAAYHHERTLRALFLVQQSVTQMASTDALTGLSNRRAFEPFVGRTMQHAARDKQQVALLLVGVDHFKAYNDQLGHAAGDAALKALARVVSQRIRRQFDLGARLGDGELGMFFYDVNVGFAWTVAEELRRDVEQRLAIAHPASPARVLTVSVGLAVSAPSETCERLYQRTDQALSMAKAQGGNRVQLAE